MKITYVIKIFLSIIFVTQNFDHLVQWHIYGEVVWSKDNFLKRSVVIRILVEITI